MSVSDITYAPLISHRVVRPLAAAWTDDCPSASARAFARFLFSSATEGSSGVFASADGFPSRLLAFCVAASAAFSLSFKSRTFFPAFFGFLLSPSPPSSSWTTPSTRDAKLPKC